MHGRILGAAVLILALGAATRADDKPVERTDLDKRIVRSVYDTALQGTAIFNNGKHDECYRLYQGLLNGIYPMLDHRPKLMLSVKEKIDKASAMKPVDGAFALREALDEIQNEIAPASKSDTKVEPKKAVLWDRLGGEKGVRTVVKDFIVAAAADKKVNFTRDGKYKLDAKRIEHLEQLLVELVSEVTGGNLKYTGTKDMKTVHAGMKITDDEFDAIAGVLLKTLEQHKVAKPEIDELMKIIGGTRPLIVEPKIKD